MHGAHDRVTPPLDSGRRQAEALGLAHDPRARGPRASQAQRIPFSRGSGRSQRPAAAGGGHARDVD